jgi:hypothetical protein
LRSGWSTVAAKWILLPRRHRNPRLKIPAIVLLDR